MPKLNLTKVAFACRDLQVLQERIVRRATGSEVRIATRMRPKRADELIGGNLYWIVKHTIIAGLEIRRFEDREDGRIDIVCSADLRIVPPKPGERTKAGAISRMRMRRRETMTAPASERCRRNYMGGSLRSRSSELSSADLI